MKRQVLCNTIAGNNCELLTITNFNSKPSILKQRPIVILTARVHPGENNSSWVMKGFLEFITSNNTYATYLRNHVIFKIIPLLNPDGVIEGNYRCNLTGNDLNETME